MRNSNQFELNWFYKYYLENGGKGIGMQQFSSVFQMINLPAVLEYLDKKFSLTLLFTKDNQFIKVII
jgi:hypothetical protein